MIKLKQSQVKAYREAMLKAQGGKCAFCGQDCKKPCLDHAHMEPYKDKIRGVICNWCNIAIGKLENARVRTGTSWTDFQRSFPVVMDYIMGLKPPAVSFECSDWHPSKRKSEVTAFRKMNADEQHKRLSDMMDGFPFVAKNATERIKIFRKLNNKL